MDAFLKPLAMMYLPFEGSSHDYLLMITRNVC